MGDEMKCVAYISKAPLTKSGVCLPIGLSGIVKASNRNKNSEITGFLCYRKGYYFQVIEGPYEVVEQLASKILVDSRHSDPCMFINRRISKRCFKTWKISVFNLVDQSQLFEQFRETYDIDLSSFNEQQKIGIKKFYDLKNTPHPENYEGKNLRLKAWPDLNSINQSQTIIDLCVKLTKIPYPFEQLVEDERFGTRDQVVEALNQFETLGILTVTESELSQNQEIETVHEKEPSSFFGAIKKFLGMR